MDEEILSYYNRELAYIRRLGAEFASQHPKIAGRLRLEADTIEDPHVSRLVESFAFLTARIRHTIEDGFPELTEALMGQLFPDYLAPIPSMSVVQIGLIDEQIQPRSISRGTTLTTAPVGNYGSCYFRTAYDVEALPVSVQSAHFRNRPFSAPKLKAQSPGGNDAPAQAVLCLTLRAAGEGGFGNIGGSRLRFFLHGQPQLTGKLYEYLFRYVTSIAISDGTGDRAPRFLPPDALKAVGFDDEESLIPYDGRTSSAHRLLTEYFCFPEKFLFVELEGLATLWPDFDDHIDIYFYFSQPHSELAQGVSKNTFQLGCTPVVNLFEARLESIAAEDIGFEKKLTISRAESDCADVHSIVRLNARDPKGHEVALEPFYGAHTRDLSQEQEPVYWHLRREVSQWFGGRVSRGTDSYLSLVDERFKVTEPGRQWVISGSALCTNRDLPDKLPFGPAEPKLSFMEGGGCLTVKCILAPTAGIQPRLDHATRWQLTTQLSLQHFTLDHGLDVLRDTLRLHDFKRSPDNSALINAVTALKASSTTARVRVDGRPAICHGVRLTLECDDSVFSGSGVYLFSAVLKQFFTHYCSVNSFVELHVKTKQDRGGDIRWPAITGKQPLI